MTKIKIKVTKDILARSANCVSEIEGGANCALALAIRDIFPDANVQYGVIIPNQQDFAKACLEINGKEGLGMCNSEIIKRELGFKTSGVIMTFMMYFDTSTPEQREMMKEEEFKLELPDWAVSKIGNGEIEEAKKIISSSKTLEFV
jgi:hypothetical protein